MRIAADNEIGILWQVPQWFMLTTSEVLYSVTSYEFAYSQVTFLPSCPPLPAQDESAL